MADAPLPDADDAPTDAPAKRPEPSARDAKRPLGDTPEAHDEITPHDLPRDHPGRNEAEHQAAEGGGVTRGDIDEDD